MTSALPSLRTRSSRRRRPSPARWWREYGRAPRIMGLDVARALAVLGMVGAHVGEAGGPTPALLQPDTWTGVINGRPSLLFAVLAGVSIALLTHRALTGDAAQVLAIRMSMVGRGAAIFLIGIALELLNTSVALILTLYGVLYIAMIPFLTWRPRRLLIAAGVLTVAGPAMLAVMDIVEPPAGPGLALVLTGTYPITVWMTLMFVGLAVGRLGVAERRHAWLLLGVGTVLTLASEGLDALAIALSPPESVVTSDPVLSAVLGMFANDAHSGGMLEIIGSGGFALAVIGACVLLSRPLRWAQLPLAALGSMPLTAYSAHVVVILLVAGPAQGVSDNSLWIALSLGLIVGALAWSMFFGRGPLERLVARVARAAASVRPTEVQAVEAREDAVVVHA